MGSSKYDVSGVSWMYLAISGRLKTANSVPTETCCLFTQHFRLLLTCGKVETLAECGCADRDHPLVDPLVRRSRSTVRKTRWEVVTVKRTHRARTKTFNFYRQRLSIELEGRSQMGPSQLKLQSVSTSHHSTWTVVSQIHIVWNHFSVKAFAEAGCFCTRLPKLVQENTGWTFKDRIERKEHGTHQMGSKVTFTDGFFFNIFGPRVVVSCKM